MLLCGADYNFDVFVRVCSCCYCALPCTCLAPPISFSLSLSLSHSLAFFIAVVLASHSARAKNVINLMISIKCSPVQGRSGLVEVRSEGSRGCKVAMGMGEGRGSGGCAENGFAFAHATALLGQLK